MIVSVINQLGRMRSEGPERAYRSQGTHSGMAIKIPCALVELAKIAASKAGAGYGGSTASTCGRWPPVPDRWRSIGLLSNTGGPYSGSVPHDRYAAIGIVGLDA